MRSRPSNFIPAVSLAVLAGLVVPMQSYLGNASSYPFPFSRLVVECLVLSVVLAAVLSLLSLVPKASAAVTALAVCVYLEAGPLSFGLPEINGGYVPELSSLPRSLADASVWAALIVLFLGFSKRIAPYLRWISLAALVLGCASLLDVSRPAGGSDAGQSASFQWQRDIALNVEFSTNRNVLVFVLDSVPGAYTTELVRNSPELKEKFPGFTVYDNLAMHDCTKYGLPGLVTGRFFDPAKDSPQTFPATMYGPDSMLAPYIAADASVYCVPDLLSYGYSNRPIVNRAPRPERKRGLSVFLEPSAEMPYLSLLCLSVYRMIPFAAKANFLYTRLRRNPFLSGSDDDFWHEHVMYSCLRASGLPFSGSSLCLLLVHTRGAHPPLVFDRDGNPLAKASVDDIHDLCYNPLWQLGRLLEVLRERGVYDRSTVIVAADHGLITAPPLGLGRNPRDSSILWVKGEGAQGALKIAETKTSNCRIAPLVKALAERPLSPEEIGGLLSVSPRHYLYETSTKGYEEYDVP